MIPIDQTKPSQTAAEDVCYRRKSGNICSFCVFLSLTQTRRWRGSIQRMQIRVGVSLFKLAPCVNPGYSCQPRLCQ
jgi:hypothetical protein